MISREDVDAGRIDFSDLVESGAPPMAPITPGEILRDELEERGVTAYALAKAMKVPANRILAILAGTRAITADTAVRLGAALGTSAEMWMTLQAGYDLELARRAGAASEVAQVAA